MREHMNKLLLTIGERIRSRRKELGISRAVLAERAGVSARFLAQLEGGAGNISIQRLADVSCALRWPLSMLLVGLGYQPASFIGLVGLRGAGLWLLQLRLIGHLLNWTFNCGAAGLSLAEILNLVVNTIAHFSSS